MNGMIVSIPLQLRRFLLACVLGIILALLYDLLRLIRRSFRNRKGITVLSDFLYSFLALSAFALFVLLPCEGDIRLFLIIGTSLGMLLYFLTASKPFLLVGESILHIFTVIIKVAVYPLYLLKKHIFLHRQKRRHDHDISKQKKESG